MRGTGDSGSSSGSTSQTCLDGASAQAGAAGSGSGAAGSSSSARGRPVGSLVRFFRRLKRGDKGQVQRKNLPSAEGSPNTWMNIEVVEGAELKNRKVHATRYESVPRSI